MFAIKEDNNIIVRFPKCKSIDDIYRQIITPDLKDEEIVYKKIFDEFKSNPNIQLKRKLIGPSEDIFYYECMGDEVELYWDIDYGLVPIRCSSKNVDYIFSVINNVLND